jgi:ubiquinone biosynthesis accessory factor UbiJ
LPQFSSYEQFAMLTQLNAHILNHLLSQNSWAADRLRRFAGKTIELSLPPMQTRLFILDRGEFAIAPADAEVHARMSLPPAAALRLLTEGQLDATQLHIDGDTELATEVGKVLQNLRWEYEEDLSHLIGDIPAHELVSFGRRAAAETMRQATSLAGMFAEYWLEEQPLIAKRRHLEGFSREVDALRDDTERLAKRLEKLEQAL